MKVTSQGGFVLVSISRDETTSFNRSWPCSPIPDYSTFLIELDRRNGDLVNITMHLEDGQYVDSADYDGDALLALMHDANNIARSLAVIFPQWAKR